MTSRGMRFEDFVAELLAKLGFNIVGKRVRVFVNGSEVGEVDILAEDAAGNKYAVEVKSGKVDVTGIRQAYVNAKVLNARPLVVARGFSNSSAEALAKELGVETIILDDNVLVKTDELMTLIELTLYKFLDEVLTGLETILEIVQDRRLTEAILKCDDWGCVCSNLGLDSSSCSRLIQRLRSETKSSLMSSFLKVKTMVKLVRLACRLFRAEAGEIEQDGVVEKSRLSGAKTEDQAQGSATDLGS